MTFLVTAQGKFLASRPVRCVPLDADRYGRTVAACSVGGVDLAQWLVSHGHAIDWPRYSKGKYAQDQKSAEKAGLGIWAGSFAPPWLYRDCVRAGGKPGKCSDEPIVR
ncbi:MULTISPECIES: thermonuclease family protein [Bradyrhizobium]|uniref:thermonuclease family protein n=1 Tax=Bradyrhizobium TaxID=374 RepID=UPI0030B955E4